MKATRLTTSGTPGCWRGVRPGPLPSLTPRHRIGGVT